jgi:metal-dependent amidase/aminoacylase/carboxypeptidase family protein
VLGERVHAFVHAGSAAAGDSAALQAHCAARLADYKVPERITWCADPLPRNANGKLMKRLLRQLEQRIRALVSAHVQGYGGEATIDYQRGYPVVVNSDAETAFAREVAAELVGDQAIVAPYPPLAGSEDFAYYLQRKPGCFLRLGNGEGGASLHNPRYDFNDEILTTGAAYWTRLVERYLAG